MTQDYTSFTALYSQTELYAEFLHPYPSLGTYLFASFSPYFNTKTHLEYKIIPVLNNKKSSTLKRMQRRIFNRVGKFFWCFRKVRVEKGQTEVTLRRLKSVHSTLGWWSRGVGGRCLPGLLVGLLPKCRMEPKAGQSQKDPLTPPHGQIDSYGGGGDNDEDFRGS